jgi:hypothetical protein
LKEVRFITFFLENCFRFIPNLFLFLSEGISKNKIRIFVQLNHEFLLSLSSSIIWRRHEAELSHHRWVDLHQHLCLYVEGNPKGLYISRDNGKSQSDGQHRWKKWAFRQRSPMHTGGLPELPRCVSEHSGDHTKNWGKLRSAVYISWLRTGS